MLKHVVFFKFKPEAEEAGIADLQQSLTALDGVIPEIREFLVGRDVIRSERSFDLALISAFDDLAAMQRYQVHPAHQAVVAKVKALCSSVAAVDFEC
jgi:quinol monooxygenase YgiN